jgi:tetratricopeptide (TPR) repeat protein
MRAFLTALPVLLLLGLLTVARAPAARADEEPKDESAASKAYRDAWWAETGGGNLNQALELYAKAIDAEGPASVKARALYRRAVVLQRIGKTEEALRALERLSKDFPGEAQLNTDARARLAEWTAVDLRSSFADWFKRYQYSPEFQAKVIDLVLRLGVPDEHEADKTHRELLTIGEAAIPALKEHVRSKNTALQARALKTLLLLGVVPDELVEVAGWEGNWTNEAWAWVPILKLPAERATLLRARVKEEQYPGPALKAALGGPEKAIAWLQTPGQGEQARGAMFSALTTVLPKDSPLGDALADLAVAPGQAPAFRSSVAWWARQSGRATAARVRAWAEYEDRELRQTAWWDVSQGKALPLAEGWPIVLARLERLSAGDLQQENQLPVAFFATLEAAPWPQDVEPTARALTAVGGALNGPRPNDKQGTARTRYAEALSHVVKTATDEAVAVRALQALPRVLPSDTGGLRALADWVRTASTRQRRDGAAMALGDRLGWPSELSREDLAVLADLLTDPTLPLDEAASLWSRVLVSKAGAALVGSAALLRRLLDHLQAVSDTMASDRNGTKASDRMGFALLNPMQQNLVGPEPVVESLLSAPERTPWSFVSNSGLKKALTDRGQLPRWRKAWREAWPRWNAEQRKAGVGLLDALLVSGEDPEMQGFLRERLRAQPSEIPLEARAVALRNLKDLTWEDLKAADDLSKPEDVDAAAEWFVSVGPTGPRVQATAEVFTALRPAFRADGPYNFLSNATTVFRYVPAVHRELAALLLAHNDPTLHDQAVEVLASRASPEDEDLWLKALKDARVQVRIAAAKGMERVPTEGIKRALVGALDDPHPDVRAAALASLDNLQKMEDLKARWRERVK